MKKVLLILTVLTLTLASCDKECTSSCGTITSDGFDASTNCYWLEIQNTCSGNKKTFCFDENVWLNNYVGDSFCVTNEPSW
tara:strand:+ start:3729 stop:3971 length:243 start_codon:yes stop_codon:yes gene_type:complete